MIDSRENRSELFDAEISFTCTVYDEPQINKIAAQLLEKFEEDI